VHEDAMDATITAGNTKKGHAVVCNESAALTFQFSMKITFNLNNLFKYTPLLNVGCSNQSSKEKTEIE
jgi:hypothetical protein